MAKSVVDTSKCLICGATPTVRSHLLPAALAQDIRADGPALWIGSTDHEGRNISQSGVFDRILCARHESVFHDCEDYTIDFLRTFQLTSAEIESGLFVRPGTDNDALVRFAASVMWRYHVSQRIETRGIDVGGWELALRQVTFDGDLAKAPDVYCLAVHQTVVPSSRFAYPPARGRFDGRVVWTIVVHGVVFMVKLDKQPFLSSASRGLVINGTQGVVGMVKQMTRKDLQAMKDITDRMKAPVSLRPSHKGSSAR